MKATSLRPSMNGATRPTSAPRVQERREVPSHNGRTSPAPSRNPPHRRQDYVPSPEEIRAACAEIQKEWSEKERRRRAGITKDFWLGKQSRPSRVSFAS